MVESNMHVYTRSEPASNQLDSISTLAALISRGASVLDLGCGAGTLGQRLGDGHVQHIDGLTHNAAEAALAAPFYRTVLTADLEHCDLEALIPGEQYDFIVCADVLEHLRNPARILAACRSKLRPGGALLISIPNVGYCGLIGDLLRGQFEYREEGLLDATHVRFFTKESFTKFLVSCDWLPERMIPILRQLTDSEFQQPFDRLPPAVARYLLATPDALTYQFVVVARAQKTQTAPPQGPLTLTPGTAAQANALFTAQLYVDSPNGYSEDKKLTQAGVIGSLRQTITFELTSAHAPWARLRLDPADRPGYLYLYSIALCDRNHAVLWRWDHAVNGLQSLVAAPHNEILVSPKYAVYSTPLVFLSGDNPWIELPVALPDNLRLRLQHEGGFLKVEMGWPMSSDYLEVASWLTSHEGHGPATEDKPHTQPRLDLKYQHLEQRNDQLKDRQRALAERNRILELECIKLNRDRTSLMAHLHWIEQSNVFRMTRPIVKLKMHLMGEKPLTYGVQRAAPSAAEHGGTSRCLSDVVDVIVPVFRGLDDTRCCIQSVLASRCETPFRLVILNDASPEPEVTQWLREVAAQHANILLLENAENLGFVGTVNRGMAQSDANDVVWLNSDAEVANDWLDRLRATAYASAMVASVTPFSNNATICSYPAFCKDNALPAGYGTAELDRLFAHVNAGRYVEVPTGVGFCMYVRRAAIQQIGTLDLDNFGKGYGEENDFCQRAIATGWRNVHALDVFVRHAGGGSFGETKKPRELAAMETLRRLHPRYEADVHRFINADPAKYARHSVDLARLSASPLPTVLAVVHDRAGGTLRHVAELAGFLGNKVTFFSLTPVPNGRVALRLVGKGEAFEWTFELATQFELLVASLRQLGTAHIHFHHLIGHDTRIMDLPKQLGVAYDFTAHDYYAFCPQITLTDHNNRYCGERGLEQCGTCLRRSPAPGGVSIESWRSGYSCLLTDARFVLAPSRDAARRIARFVPAADVRYAPHTDMADSDHRVAQPIRQQRHKNTPLKIVVIGALSPIKGADVLEDVAKLATSSASPVELHLLGFAYRSLSTQPRTSLTVHGAYQEDDLPALLAWLQPDVVWFPAQWPETYSYTLSACLSAGLPVVAPNLGAFGERLSNRPWTWIRPWDFTPTQWLRFFEDIRLKHFVTGEPPSVASLLEHDPVDALVRGWSYHADYLSRLSPVSPAPPFTLEDIQLRCYGVQPMGLQAARDQTKNLLLGLVLRARSAPALRHIARRIPLDMQRRVKSWLQS